jgi:hypothetical protein
MHDWNDDYPPPWADEESVPVREQIEQSINRVRKKRFEIPCEKDADDDKPFYPLR